MAVTVLDVAQLIGARMQGGTAEQAQVPITEVGLNSAELPAGALFAAVPGTRVHGARFAADTAAAAILTDEAGWGLLSAAGETRPVLVVDDVRSVLGVAAAAVYGDPSSQLTVIGITGTSGKTTTSYMLEAGLLAAGYRVGLIGTTGTQINGRPVPTSLTTPEAPTLQALFVQMLAEGVTHVVMEVSSHALMRGGQEFRLAAPSGAVVAATVPLPGRFNVANAALALALADTVGVDMTALLPGLAGVGVPGRMEVVDCGQDFLAVVDYAHKPAAIKAVLATVRGQITGRIGLVVGAGGDRDHSKRPIMGAEAAAGADYVVVTDDNPRNEDPAAIRAQVLAGTAAGSAEVVEIGDRRAAIRQVVAWAKPGDAVIIAGKGHEVGQLIDGVTHHFDDREELRAALEGRDQ